MADGRDEEVGVAVVVDVGERATHRDGVRGRQPSWSGDVHEATVAEVLPELVGAELRDEVEIGETVAIDVRGAQAAPVVVVRELITPARVVDHAVLERDAAGRSLIGEPEVVNRLRARGQYGFLAAPLDQPRRRPGRAARGNEE